MSDKMDEKKVKENTEQKEKVMTNYDRKMQRKKELEEKQKKEDRRSMIMGILVVLVMLAVVASFPIRTYLATHETYVTVGGKEVNRVEFDMNYLLAKEKTENQWGNAMVQFGYNPDGDMSTQMYSDTLSWKDHFEKEAVEQIKQNVAMKAEAEAAGFTYDTTADYAKWEQSVKEVAQASNMSEKDFIKSQYGSYATKSRIEEYLKESMYLNAYYQKVVEDKTPSLEEVNQMYQEDSDLYDSVDYRITLVVASIEEGATEEQITQAMKDAKTEAEGKDASAGELIEGGRWSSLNVSLQEWLFDAARKAGERTVIEDLDNGCYYVVQFEKRYLNEEYTVDAHVLISASMEGETILNEWNSGEATEESFAALCDKYSEDTTVIGGLYEALLKNDMNESLSAWLFDEARTAGDTTAIKTEDGRTYVMYYVGTNDPEWVLDAKQNMINQIMPQYLNDLKENVTVEDTKGKLNFLKVEAVN